MREIKFRGKCINEDAWAFGSLIQRSGRSFIFEEGVHVPQCKIGEFITEVIPESVGEFTGLKDKNGVSIYEGDILRNPPKSEWEKKNFVAFEVFFHDNDCADKHVGWQFNRLHFQGSICGYHMMGNFLPKYTERMEIIGNICENLELIKGVSK